MLIRKLVECVSKGGNLLLNVGPDARGCIPPQSQQILARIGAWMEKNGDSIYGCGRADVPKPDFGYVTARGDTLYYHVIDAPIGYLPLHKTPGQQLSARLLATGRSWIPAPTGSPATTRTTPLSAWAPTPCCRRGRHGDRRGGKKVKIFTFTG